MALVFVKRASDELGFSTLLNSSRDCKRLCTQKFVRMLAYGSSTLVLALFLAELDISVARIGIFMTLTLLGDVALSLMLTIFADGLGRRRILTAGALMMVGSGICFTLTSSWWILVIASVFGVISPSGNEIGPFQAIEESILAQLTPKDVRSDIFAWYSLIGSAGAAVGTITAGAIVQALNTRFGWTLVASYRAMFAMYSVIGLVKLTLILFLSEACEAEKVAESQSYEAVQQDADDVELETQEADDGENDEMNGDPTKHSPTRPMVADLPNPARPGIGARIIALLPKISATSISILWKLCCLFAIDSFASGLVPVSWLTYYFTTKFDISAETLGQIFFATNIVASASGLVASSLAKRIGLVQTMVFTHLPSSLFLALIPVPSNPIFATILLILRSSTATMDRAPRQAFLAAAVLPNERTAIMGTVNVIKTLAQSAGPSVTGELGSRNKFWIVFLVAGSLKATYDLFMLKMFLGFKGREDGA